MMKQKISAFVARRGPASVLALLLPLAIGGFVFQDTTYLMKVNKSIDVFGRVYKEVTLNYVDEVDPEKFMASGIEGLLGSLDPYTNFYDEADGNDVELITSGKYGGIGITVGLRDGVITITSLMEGYSAQRQGLLPGDRIVEIDGTSVSGMKPENMKTLTRGEPGTEVRVSVERDGESGPLTFVLLREEIELKNISFADTIGTGIGYIRLDRFTRTAGEELRLALRDLKLKTELHGVILDLRDNPGGVLDAAVDVAQKFLPKSSLVVTTRGRRQESEQRYVGTEEPMMPAVPLIVLMDRHSASASEVVAGAIQDLDRGVILGTRSFGKGLVQTVVPLPYGTQLKMTTGKYYTPSGRCIQEIDYMKQDADGVFAVTPESLRQEFKTANGRSVFASGGITPDTLVNDPEESAVHAELMRKLMYVKFATRFVAHRSDSTLPPSMNSALLEQFQGFLDEQHFSYEEEGEKKLAELKKLATTARYGEEFIRKTEELEQILHREKKTVIGRFDAQVLRALRSEIMSRYRGEQSRIREDIATDPQVGAAKRILLRRPVYERLLASPDTK